MQQTQWGGGLICLRAISYGDYEAGWEACGTAGGCELMLLTLGNEEQTDQGHGGGRQMVDGRVEMKGGGGEKKKKKKKREGGGKKKGGGEGEKKKKKKKKTSE